MVRKSNNCIGFIICNVHYDIMKIFSLICGCRYDWLNHIKILYNVCDYICFLFLEIKKNHFLIIKHLFPFFLSSKIIFHFWGQFRWVVFGMVTKMIRLRQNIKSSTIHCNNKSILTLFVQSWIYPCFLILIKVIIVHLPTCEWKSKFDPTCKILGVGLNLI